MIDSADEAAGRDDAASLDSGLLPPEAPAWRRCVARAIDLFTVVVVFALFLTPVIATRLRPASPLLKASAWVYVAVFVALVLSLLFTKRDRRRRHVTVGPSIMDLHPVLVGKRTRLVRTQYVPNAAPEKRGRAAAAVILPLILLGAAFVAFELIAYL